MSSPGLTTADSSYDIPLRPKVTMLSNDASTTYLTYDSFNPLANNVKVLQVLVSTGMNQAGTFSIFVEDFGNNIDRTKVGCGNKVIISASKTATGYQDILRGYCKKVMVNRDDTGVMYYTFSGYGSQIICNERIIDFQKFATRSQMGSSVASNVDQAMTAYNLFKTVFEGTAQLPVGGSQTLIAQGQFTENGIDPRVNNFIPAIQQPLVEASAVLNKIADYSGAIWGIQNDDIFFRYPTAIHSGITIKNGMDSNDLADKTAYWTGPYSYVDSTDQVDGFANRLLLKGGTISTSPNVSSTSGIGFTSLFNKDLAQQIIPGSAKLKNIALLLSVIGTGGAANVQSVTGALIQDPGTGFPNGAKVMDLQIPLSSISTTPSAVFDFNYKFHVEDLIPYSPYWVVLYAKGTDESNTVRWHHDGDLNTPNRFSAARQAVLNAATEDRNQFPLKTDTGGWSVSNTGPVYGHAFFENIRALTEASDPLSQQKYGVVEAVHDVPFISDNQTMQNYASSVLASLAKPIRQFTMANVTIPNNFVWLPGQLVDIVDVQSGIAPPKAIAVEIQQVTYAFTAATTTNTTSGAYTSSAPTGGGARPAHPHGATYVELLCVQYVDFLTDSLT